MDWLRVSLDPEVSTRAAANPRLGWAGESSCEIMDMAVGERPQFLAK